MKKFLGIFVAVTLCLCMLAPAAVAADDNSLKGILSSLEGVDLGTLTDGELSQILGGLNLEGFDVSSLKSAIETGDSDKLAGLEDALKSLGTSVGGSSSDSSDASDGASSALGGLSDLLGGMDMSWITDVFSNPSDALSSVTDLLGGLDTGNFDLSSLLDTISGAFSGNGIDLSSLTSGIDLGSFDISSILGGLGGGSSEGSSDQSGGAAGGMLSGIMDTLMSGLSSLGLDTSLIEGLLDNEIVDFFANLYIGLGEVINPGSDSDETPSTTKPAVVTTETPKTGDTSAVVVALATLSLASAAAFVCLKKKKED